MQEKNKDITVGKKSIFITRITFQFDRFKAALDPSSLINSLALYFDGVSCCKCLILRILNTDSFKTYQG